MAKNRFKKGRLTLFNTPILTPLLALTSRLLCLILRWKVVVTEIKPKSYVILMAPHTTNWDFFALLATALAYKQSIHWAGKKSLFKGPLAWFFRWCGGFPIYKQPGQGTVECCVAWFKKNPNFILGVAPAGSRFKAQWKSGFYHIAVQAQVPIVMGYIDRANRCSGIKGVFQPSGNYDEDITLMKEYYRELDRAYEE